MNNTYENQILNTCIQTYYNLHGTMPGTQELIEMLGEAFEKIVVINGGNQAA